MDIVPWVWYNGIPEGAARGDSIIPYTLETHSTADLYYD